MNQWATFDDTWGAPDPERHAPGRGSRVLVVEVLPTSQTTGPDWHPWYARAIDEWGRMREVMVQTLVFDLPEDPR